MKGEIDHFVLDAATAALWWLRLDRLMKAANNKRIEQGKRPHLPMLNKITVTPQVALDQL